MNIDFPTQNSHRSCLSAVKRARYPLKDERRPDQGAGSCRAWHFFSDRKRKLFKITESMFYFASLRNMYVYGQGVE